MASRFLFILLLCTSLSILAYSAAPPVNLVLNQPLEQMGIAPTNASAPTNLTLANDNKRFRIPGTQTTLVFSRFSKVVSQSELDLCIVEALVFLFNKVLAIGEDGFLPRNSVEYKYGNVVINMYDFSPPSFRMRYSSVVETLRGIALFTSMHGYYAMTFDVYEGRKGHVGTGEFGPIVPG